MPGHLPIPPPLSNVALSPDSTSSSTDSRPRRKIYTATDLDPWFTSRAYADLEAYTLELCHAVEGKSLEEDCFESETTLAIVAFLQEAQSWVDDIPLQTTPQRFGNKAFRDWLDKVTQRNDDFQNSLVLGSSLDSSILPELSFNFLSSFGSGARLDYGTGHELSFLLYLLSLRLIGILTERDDQAVVLRIFATYLDVARKLQKVFKLEPAGSKGVWGLDDHQHLSYLFGASQLIDHSTLRPTHILQPQILAPLSKSYLFPSSILHIHALKSGPFSEHSPLLHQIASTVPNWAKVQNGLWKMYREEVLAKVPVVQHLRFGRLIRWTDRNSGDAFPSTGDGREEEADGEGETELESDRGQLGTMKAPWAQGATPSSAPSSTSSSVSRVGQPVISQAASRRTPYTVSTVSVASKPASFAPPPLFPSRFPSTPTRIEESTRSGRRTLAQEGGAAAQSSPFGVLGSVTNPVTTRGGEADREGGDLSGVETTKAPWAR